MLYDLVMSAQPRQSLMHYLGAFFGHVVKAVRTDVTAKPVEVRRETQEQICDTLAGAVTVRRTVIEEVQLGPAAPQNKDMP